MSRAHHKKKRRLHPDQDRPLPTRTDTRWCAKCGCRLNSYNTGDYCALCRRKREEAFRDSLLQA